MLINKEEKDLDFKAVRSRKKLYIISGIIFILIGAGLSAWYSLRAKNNVKTITITKQTLKDIVDVSGAVESEQDITLKSSGSGIIISRYIKENIRVKSGTPLLIIDPQQSKLQLNQTRVNSLNSKTQAETELLNARKALADAMARHRLNVENLSNQINKAKSSVAFLEKEIKRNEALFREGAIPRQTLDSQKQQIEQARLDLKTATDNLGKVTNDQGEIVIARSRIAQANTALGNSIRQSDAAISIAKDALQRTTVNTPFSGTITKWLINNGDFVIPGTPLAKFQDLNNIRLKLPLNELDFPKVSAKSPVDIVFDAYPEKTYKGKITWISQSSVLDNENVQTFPVKVEFDNLKLLIKPGMSGDAQITVSEKKDVIAVPLASINKKEEKIYVKIMEDNNNVKEVEIKPGISTLDSLEVRSGLKLGDRLVVEEAKK